MSAASDGTNLSINQSHTPKNDTDNLSLQNPFVKIPQASQSRPRNQEEPF